MRLILEGPTGIMLDKTVLIKKKGAAVPRNWKTSGQRQLANGDIFWINLFGA